jgi:class 3 adenylate cyclase
MATPEPADGNRAARGGNRRVVGFHLRRRLDRFTQSKIRPAVEHEPGPEHRSIMVVDIVGSSRWNNRMQLRAREVLRRVMRAAFGSAGIEWHQLDVEDRGDGMIIFVPPSVSKVDLLVPLIPRLATLVHEHNASVGDVLRMRLRVSVHAGEVHRDVDGWVGSDLILACRLIDGEPVRETFRTLPNAFLVLVVSDHIYQGIVRHGYRDIDPATYAEVDVAVKEINTRAWLHVADPRSAQGGAKAG